MPPPLHQLGLTPSMLDRLTDPESAGTAIMTGYSPEKMYAAVLRDLEDLLNTRRSITDIPPQYDEVIDSIVGYGLPDIASVQAISTFERNTIATAIGSMIRRYEPRLRDVVVVLLNPEDDLTRQSVKFRVDARLDADPYPDIAFDTILEMGSGHYVVTPTANE